MKASTPGMWGSNRNFSCAVLNRRPLFICLTFVLISVVAAAQTRPPRPTGPILAPTYGSGLSSGTTSTIAVISNQRPLPEAKKQRKDTCLLSPLDLTDSSGISVTQLRIPTKARREYQRACSGLVKKNSASAEQHLRRAIQEFPKYSAAWVTLGQVLADEHKSEDARNACSQAATMDSIYVPAYLCLAEIASRTQEWREELQYSSRALELDPTNLLAYEYYAATNANLGNLGEAERSGLRATELNNNNQDPGVYFLLAQIYQLKGDAASAGERFRQYLKYSRDPHRAALTKQILAKMENGQHELVESSESTASWTMAGGSAPRWVPTAIDEEVPPVPDNANCPLPQILEETGQRAKELVENLERFTATEQIEHIQFGKNGEPRRKPTSELFSYTAEIKQGTSGKFWLEEYRRAEEQSGRPPFEDIGTVTLALVFHPKIIENFNVRCEGQTYLQGKPAWQLRFEEVSDPTERFAVIQIKNIQYWMRFEGRAWISADDYHVLRLKTDLVAPIPEISLQLKHSDVAYAPVEFASHKLRIWLPESASNGICYRGRCYQRVHRFSHFQLFQVDTEQRTKEPVPENRTPDPTSRSDPTP